jgi:hypothetical protein
MDTIQLRLIPENRISHQILKLFSISLLFITLAIFLGFQNSYAQLTNDTASGSQLEIRIANEDVSNTTISETTVSQEAETDNPIQLISKIRVLLNQTVEEYNSQNYTGAEALATEAYLDNYEYVEMPLAEKDRTLMETTEVMMREELRQMILDEVPPEEILTHVENINTNLDRAEELLSGSPS